jgi:hypothetical protein
MENQHDKNLTATQTDNRNNPSKTRSSQSLVNNKNDKSSNLSCNMNPN